MTSWMTGVCEANGINIHYLRTGGSKPPLVLLHVLAPNCLQPHDCLPGIRLVAHRAHDREVVDPEREDVGQVGGVDAADRHGRHRCRLDDGRRASRSEDGIPCRSLVALAHKVPFAGMIRIRFDGCALSRTTDQPVVGTPTSAGPPVKDRILDGTAAGRRLRDGRRAATRG